MRALALLAVLALAAPVRAQGMIQVVIGGVGGTLPTPVLSDLTLAYERGDYPVQVLYNDPTGRPATVRFRLTVELEGRSVVEAESDPVTLAPGVTTYRTLGDAPAVRFPGGAAALIARLDAAVADDVRATGRLPQGLYDVTLEAVPEDAGALIASLPALLTFSVDYAEPPVLLTPADGEIVQTGLVLFSWTPPLVPPGTLLAYDLRVVEVGGSQTPLQALESRPPHVNTTLIGQTTYPYSPLDYPLTPGAVYVWQVVARDAAGAFPFSDDGASELGVFLYGGPTPEGGLVWSYPAVDPFLEVTIYDFTAEDGGIRADGVQAARLAGVPTEVTFRQVVLDTQTHAIRSGVVVLADGTVLGPTAP